MSISLDDELRAAFVATSEFIQPPPGLADHARRTSHARRRRLVATVAACAVVLAGAAAAYATGGPNRPAPAHPTLEPRVLIRVSYPVSQVAVGGRYLYLASNDSALVAAYDHRTGRLIRRVSVPGGPTSLTVGPGGLVWVGIDGDSSPGALVVFSPDLATRATGASVGGPGPVVPTSRQTALAPTQYGLIEVHMPTPGRPGRASQRLVPGTSLGPSQNTAPGVWAGLLAGRVVVQVTNGYGYDSHLVIAGQPGRTFGGALQHEVGAVTSTGTSLWAQMFAIRNSYAASSGPLVRLDGGLRATTPESIAVSPVLAKTEKVWSSGDTVWAATAVRDHSLVCFSAGGDAGPVITVQASGSVAAMTAAASTAYVATVQGDSYGPSVITSYPVPAPCR